MINLIKRLLEEKKKVKEELIENRFHEIKLLKPETYTPLT